MNKQIKSNIKKKFHLIARAIIRDGNNLLVVKVKNADHCFLPGGHNEIGETLTNTLVREIKEETGLSLKVKQYLGIIENKWKDDDVHHYEINHIFKALIPKINAKKTIISQEDHLEFLWIKTNDLKKQNLLPLIIQPMILNWLKGKKKIWQKSSFK